MAELGRLTGRVLRPQKTGPSLANPAFACRAWSAASSSSKIATSRSLSPLPELHRRLAGRFTADQSGPRS